MIEIVKSFESHTVAPTDDLSAVRTARRTGTVAPRRRAWRVTGPQAAATWTLQRQRKPADLPGAERRLLTSVAAGVSLSGSAVAYGTAAYALRPSPMRLLRVLLQNPAADAAVPAACAAAYGKPVSLRAIRQSVFRINRAFENVDCPLVVYCHASRLLLRQRFRTF